MGNCKFCGEPAGFLRRSHKACKVSNAEGRKSVTALVQEFVSKPRHENITLLEKEIASIAHNNHISADKLKASVLEGWETAVENAFADDILDEHEEERLAAIQESFGLTQDELNQNESFTRVVKGAILRDVLNGNVPERLTIQGEMPFNLQKSESIIWLFQDVDYFTQKVQAVRVSETSGFSMRITKRLYYRTGSFQGQTIESTETVYVDNGTLGITDKHVYFSSPSTSFRIRLDKILSFMPYEDGIGLHKDANHAQPQTFITGDGWFTYNLIANASQL